MTNYLLKDNEVQNYVNLTVLVPFSEELSIKTPHPIKDKASDVSLLPPLDYLMQMSHMSMSWTACACHDCDVKEMQLLNCVYLENVCFIIPVEMKP